jgi:hypothetical protein
MLLTEAEVQRSQTLLQAAFPRFTRWEVMNERNDDYVGFSLWGQYKVKAETSSPILFVTFDTYQEKWKGHLTVGKHCYYWSSADVGDAHLLDTEPCVTLAEAIAALKRRIKSLVAALQGPEAEPLGSHVGEDS